jgi:hypothetical protein
VIATVFAGLFSLLIRREVNPALALPLVVLALLASMIHFLTRPHVVSWLFTLTWFWILESSERECLGGRGGRSRRWLWILPALMLLWVNVHGGFLMGFILLVIFWLATTWSWLSLKDNRIEETLEKIAAGKRSRDLAWVGLFSAAASLVNPYGWKLHEHIYSYLSNRFLMDHIEEFQSPNFHGLAPRCFVLLVLITLAALAVSGSKLRLSEGLTVLFVVYAGVYSSRNIPVSSVLLVMIVAPLISPSMPVPGFLQRMQRIESRLGGHLWPVIVLILTLGIVAQHGRGASGTLINAHFDPKRMPVDAVNYLQKSGMKGPVLSPDYWGGYLIYRLYPKQQVVVDDRHDLYGEAFFKSYLKMMHGERGWQEFLRDHPASCLLLPRDSALASILIEKTRWKPIYEDDIAIAFVPIPGPVEYQTSQ